MSLDLRFVREQFPALGNGSRTGAIHFDNAAGSYPCRQTIDRLTSFYRDYKVQPYGPHAISRRGGELMDEARARLAHWLGVTSDHVHFGPSTSQNSYVLAQAFGELLEPGDEIVVTNQDHEANTGVWRKLASRGIVVREWQVDPQTGRLDPRDLDRLSSDRTRLVTFPHCSNIVADINPVSEICRAAHAAGALTVVDGVGFAGHGYPDLSTLGADIYLFSTYKTYGPHQGIMVMDPGLATRLPAQCHYFNADNIQKRLTPAGPDHAQVAACAGIADYFDALYRHHEPEGDLELEGPAAVRRLIRDAEQKLLAPLIDYALSRDDVRVLGPTDPLRRAPTLSLALEARDPSDVARQLGERNINCCAGHFYAPRVLEAMGVDPGCGVLRLSMLHYNSAAEVKALVTALEEIR